MDDLMKYAERQTYNTTPDYDDDAVNQAVAMPLLNHQPAINPNLLKNPLIKAQQQQYFMNQQIQMLMLQQQQQIAYHQQIAQF
uniref:Uncharacterized protein n=1 Tax=Panagrolaimus sp. PS1159 TaxID=55785 RepID=A0AC35GKR1_9BILA